MKKLEFETSKGEFLVVDAIEKPNIHTGINLSKITEEQASEIVDKVLGKYKNYETDDRAGNYNRFVYDSAIESLNSLLKSKGVHLFKNPVTVPEYQCDNFGNSGICEIWINEYNAQAEKTFYNPYIFKTRQYESKN